MKEQVSNSQSNIKDILATSLEKLMKTKSFENICIHEVIKDCGVSRTSFYRHFHDKYDLMNWIYRREVEELLEQSEDPADWRQITEQTLIFMQSKRSFFLKVINYNKQNSFIDFLFEYSRKYFIVQLQNALQSKELPYEMVCSIEFYCAGITYTLRRWIENRMEEPPEVVTKRQCDNIPYAICKYMK